MGYLLSLEYRADAVVAHVAEGNDPGEGPVGFEPEEVLPGASDEAAVVGDGRGREGTGRPRRRASCKGNCQRTGTVGTQNHSSHEAALPFSAPPLPVSSF
jgi:hypothetical protein